MSLFTKYLNCVMMHTLQLTSSSLQNHSHSFPENNCYMIFAELSRSSKTSPKAPCFSEETPPIHPEIINPHSSHYQTPCAFFNQINDVIHSTLGVLINLSCCLPDVAPQSPPGNYKSHIRNLLSPFKKLIYFMISSYERDGL